MKSGYVGSIVIEVNGGITHTHNTHTHTIYIYIYIYIYNIIIIN